MKFSFFIRSFCICTLVIQYALADVEIHPIRVGGTIDAGQCVKGRVMEARDLDMQFITRTGVGATFSATVDEKLHLTVNTGGLFWHSLPELAGQPHTRLIKFGPGVGEASGNYSFGDADSPWAKLQFGLFAHKYNPDVKNLGEYLLRSGTYPGYLWSGGYGGWTIINGAAHLAEGLKFSTSHLDGAFTQDLCLYMQRFIEPEFDLDLAYLATMRFGNVLELGAGIDFAHLIPVTPSVTTPSQSEGNQKRANGYAQQNIQIITENAQGGSDTTYKSFNGPLPKSEWQKPGYELTDTMIIKPTDPEERQALINSSILDPLDPRYQKRYVSVAGNGVPQSQIEHYTFKGTKVMGRFSFNLQSILESDILNPNDLKLYGEVAILGLKNYPYFYEKRADRMPIMLGFNFPTFKLLDMLSVEVEYYSNPFPQDIQQVKFDVRPIWNLPIDEKTSAQPEAYEFDPEVDGASGKDFVKWSIWAKKSLNDYVRIYLQVANDHYRAILFDATPDYLPMTRSPEDWYYMIRFETGW